MRLLIIIFAGFFLQTACTRDYAPNSDMNGEQIYQAACFECHKPANNGSIYFLKTQQANIYFISNKIKFGSLLMPSFPNLGSAKLSKISHFVLEHAEITGD
jgi:hypothetical protein